MNNQSKAGLLLLLLIGGATALFAGVTSTYYYEYSVSGGELNADHDFIGTSKSNEGIGTGLFSGSRRASGWRFLPANTLGVVHALVSPGDGHSEVRYRINANTGALHGYLFSDARHSSQGDSGRAQSTLKMGCRQYYRADGNETMTVRVSFHYDGTYQSDYLCYVNLATYVTKVLNESVYFSEFEKGIYLWMLDLPESVDLYDDRFGNKQTIAETIYLYQTDNFGGGLPSPANGTAEFEFTVEPNELFTVDTMFDAYITANAQESNSEGKVDFSNTASSSVEIINGVGSLTKIEFPDSIRFFDGTHTITNNEATITRYTGTGANVCIPESIDGFPVTTLARGAFMRCNVINVIIPESVTTIEGSVFSDCDQLKSINLPTALTCVNESTFLECSSLIEITIPEQVTTIGMNAFFGCSSLTEITIPSSVTNISQGAFAECPSLMHIGGLEGIITIGNYAFTASGSTKITLPATATTIGEGAFMCCANLQSIHFKGNAPVQGDVLFEKSPNVTVYYLPETTGWSATYGDRPTVLWNPKVQTGDADFGVKENCFGFNITHSSNPTVIVEKSDSLTDPVWSAIAIYTLNEGSSYFSDANWTNNPACFYRLRMP